MRRRQFITLLGGAAATMAANPRSWPAGRIYYAFGVATRQPAVNDLNLQPRQRRSRPRCVVFVMLVGQASSP